MASTRRFSLATCRRNNITSSDVLWWSKIGGVASRLWVEKKTAKQISMSNGEDVWSINMLGLCLPDVKQILLEFAWPWECERTFVFNGTDWALVKVTFRNHIGWHLLLIVGWWKMMFGQWDGSWRCANAHVMVVHRRQNRIVQINFTWCSTWACIQTQINSFDFF